MKKMVNGVLVDMTPAEEAEFHASLVVPLEEQKERAMREIAQRWAEAESHRKLLDADDPDAKQASVKARARGLAIAVKNAPNKHALNAIDLAAGWD
jgi:hypothetical protein